jgi:hypothetical protein
MEPKSAEAKIQCSFCGKSQDDVRKIVAGPKVYICDECVDLCDEILEREGGTEPPVEKLKPASPIAACPLCNLPKNATELRVIEDKGALCVECIEAVRSLDDEAEINGDATK